MAKIKNKSQLSIIIPTLNESGRLPLLLADINHTYEKHEVIIIDGGSTDQTVLIGKLTGAKVYKSSIPNRGAQLQIGADNSHGNWLLFLHADCRLHNKWNEIIQRIINDPNSTNFGWFFDFKIKSKRPMLYFLEQAVAVRSYFLQRPYGDQGLLISKILYNKIGGYSPMFLMEDLDLVERLSKTTRLKRIGVPILIDAKKWKNSSVINQAFKNACLRQRWRRGESTMLISKDYYRKSND